MTDTEIGAREARAQLSDLLGRVAYGKERIVLTRNGKPVAALVPVDVASAPAEIAPAEPEPSKLSSGERARLEAMARGDEAGEDEPEETEGPAEFNADVAALNLYGVISAAVKAWPASESLKPLISTMRQVLGHLERAEKERSND